jgi:hypothetical protein
MPSVCRTERHREAINHSETFDRGAAAESLTELSIERLHGARLVGQHDA